MKANFFKEVPYKPFPQIKHLSVLDLEDNALDNLSGQPFRDLKKLTKLSLKSCALTNFNTHAVDGLDSLRSLNLGQNKISQFPKDAFRQLEHLEDLEIGLNYISELTYDEMFTLKNLKTFSMLGCHRPLKIRSNSFRDNSKLISVNITKCPELTELETKVFTALPFLRSLNFHMSGLTSVAESSADWLALEHFDLSNNPLRHT